MGRRVVRGSVFKEEEGLGLGGGRFGRGRGPFRLVWEAPITQRDQGHGKSCFGPTPKGTGLGLLRLLICRTSRITFDHLSSTGPRFDREARYWSVESRSRTFVGVDGSLTGLRGGGWGLGVQG